MSVEMLADQLRAHPAIRSKLGIASTTSRLGLTASCPGSPGDDAAVLPRGDSVDLFAGEGFIPAFVADDPWFAGWCGVMVNLSDIAAMGGRATALVTQVWAPDAARAAPLLAGLRDASAAYGVPIVGGHTNLSAPDLNLAVSVLGQAARPITSFDAEPGDILLVATDHRGQYRNFDNYCAALEVDPDRLRSDLELLPTVAEAGLVTAGKDISQGGIAGTALMLAEASQVGLEIDLDAITTPAGVSLSRWLVSFPSFGFLLTAKPETVDALAKTFLTRGIHARPIGRIHRGSAVCLTQGTENATFWDHAFTPYLGLTKGASHA